MKDSLLRSAAKAFSWRVCDVNNNGDYYFITGENPFKYLCGLFEFVSKIVLFYAHERIWGWFSRPVSQHQLTHERTPLFVIYFNAKIAPFIQRLAQYALRFWFVLTISASAIGFLSVLTIG